MKRSLLLVPIVLAVSASTVCADKETGGEFPAAAKEIVARVNGVPVYRRDLDRRLLQERSNTEKIKGSEEKPLSPAARRAAARKLRSDVLDSLIDHELLNLEALERKVKINEKQIEARWMVIRRSLARGDEPADDKEVARRMAQSGFTPEQYKEELRKEARVRALKQHLLPPPETISEKEIARCYKEYRSRFIVPERVHVRELVVPVPPRAEKAAVDEAAERMKMLKSRLDTGTSFERLAWDSSAARSARSGGDIGWRTRGQLGAELGNLAFSLKEGEVGGPVRTPAGLTLIKVVEKQSERVYSLEEVRDNIITYLRQKARDSEIEKLTAKLRESANIEYVVQP